MRVEDIRHMMAGQSFTVFKSGEPPRQYKPVNMALCQKYSQAHRMTQLFGLPNGKGWANETSLTLEVLSYYARLDIMIENWLTRKDSKRG